MRFGGVVRGDGDYEREIVRRGKGLGGEKRD